MKSLKRRAESYCKRLSLKNSMGKNKRGMSLTDLWPAFTLIAGLFILVIVMLVIFGPDGLGGFFTEGTVEHNATITARDKFIAILPMLGVMLLIVVLGAVIGVVIGALWYGGSGGSRRA